MTIYGFPPPHPYRGEVINGGFGLVLDGTQVSNYELVGVVTLVIRRQRW